MHKVLDRTSRDQSRFQLCLDTCIACAELCDECTQCAIVRACRRTCGYCAENCNNCAQCEHLSIENNKNIMDQRRVEDAHQKVQSASSDLVLAAWMHQAAQPSNRNDQIAKARAKLQFALAELDHIHPEHPTPSRHKENTNG